MPRQTVKELTTVQVDALKKPGYHRVGGVSGLCLQVKASGARSWVLRLTFGGRRKDLGLGSYPTVTLAMARELARMKVYAKLAGLEPSPAAPAANGTAPTFDAVVEMYLTDRITGMKNNDRSRRTIRSSLHTYASPTIGRLPVSEIDVHHMEQVLRPIWNAKPETASRVRARIAAVLDFATARRYRSGDNPAAWNGSLSHLLPPPGKIHKKKHHPACPVADLPGFMVALRGRAPSSSRLALEFLILTAARSGEVRKATWDEVDLDAGIWTVPASRMKGEKEHRVPLSRAAIELLRAAPRFAATNLIFPGAGGTRPMSDMTLAAIIKKMQAAELKAGRKGWVDRVSGGTAVPHGFRSTFRDWAAEHTEYQREMAEIALAHRVGTAVERAYQRGDMLAKRRRLMDAWAAFAAGMATADITVNADGPATGEGAPAAA